MKNKVVGAVVGAALAALLVSACSSEGRPYGSDGGGAAGTSGSGPAENGGSASGGNLASAGDTASAGTSGGGPVGGSPAEGGAGGQGGLCEQLDCESCVGATPAPGTDCGECGTYVCNPDLTTTSCSDPKYNACGGCAELAGDPGTACGECGAYECAADKESVTCNDPGKNVCGGCGVLSNAPGSSCGDCGDWECTADKTGVQCSGLNANACGGCGALTNAPGAACGVCGKYECSTDKTTTTCKDPGKNACGGCTALTGTLNGACGNGGCGKLTCASDMNSLTCTGDVPNACGGCSTLTPAGAVKDGSCGTCGRKWACNPDRNSLSCVGTAPNVCGGCTPIGGTVGSPCGACSVTACASDKNSLECKSQCTGAQVCWTQLNQCKVPNCTAADSCGKSDGAGSTCTNSRGNCPDKPNTDDSCSGSTCAYVCTGLGFNRTLSCSTSQEPACGSWDFESNDPEEEGWFLTPDMPSNAARGSLYITTAPGPGAGTRSLALNIDGTTGDTNASISIDFCPGGALATGIFGVFHARVWFAPSDNKGGLAGPGYTYLNDGAGTSVGGNDVNCPAGEWFDVPSRDIEGVSVKRAEVSISGIEGHKGVLYFDNIHFD